MPVEIVPLQDNMLADAALLLAARHGRDREFFSELPAKFESPRVAQIALEAAWGRPGASGCAALRDGRLVGYLLGDVTVDTLMGRTAWIRLAGHALDKSAPADLYADLYTATAPHWLAQGCFAHYVMVPAADRAVLDAWFALGFGQQQAYALRSFGDAAPADLVDYPELEIRLATPEDRAALRDVADIIASYQMRAPIWAPSPPEHIEELRDGYAGIPDDETAILWLALRGERIVGFQAYYPAEAGDDNPLIPEGCVELVVAATREEERGEGIGHALTQRGFAEARARGYTYCLTDWRVTNLLSSRFWPRQGFRPVVYRLERRIDERIVWAAGAVTLTCYDNDTR